MAAVTLAPRCRLERSKSKQEARSDWELGYTGILGWLTG